MGRRRVAALPPAFSLLNSEFNNFLHAPVGEADDHQQLTLLSAFSRAGLDPWQQAAQLQRFPRERARQSLVCILGTLPDVARSPAEAEAIADSLIAVLPQRLSRKARLVAIVRRWRLAVFRRNSR